MAGEQSNAPDQTNRRDDQTSLIIQREVGMALRLSFKAATREPLPQQIALLLLRLALAESLQAAVEQDENKGERPLGDEGSSSATAVFLFSLTESPDAAWRSHFSNATLRLTVPD